MSFISCFYIFYVVVMDIILVVSISIHELFHAIAAKRNGAFCAEIGYKFELFLPCAYTTLCGIKEIKSKIKASQVFYSGIGANGIIAAVSLLLMNSNLLKNSLFVFLIFGCNLCLILVNSILIIKSDVYYIFCVLSGKMNLKEETKEMIKGKCCVTTGKVIYFLLSYVVEPIAVIVLLIIAIGKIGGKVLW